jgi:hypothetical protein
MAILISFFQYNLSEKESTLLKRQTEQSEVQTTLAKEQLIRSRITDSVQIEIAKKQQNYIQSQTKLLEVQTNFLYLPNLKAEFNDIFDSNNRLILINEGKNDITDIRIREHTGYYKYYDNTFNIYFKALNDWKQIKLIKSGKFLEIPLDTSGLRIDLNNLAVTKNEAKIGGLLDPAFNYVVRVVECFIIKFKSGPDLRDRTIIKYLEVREDSRNKKLMLNDLDNFDSDRKRIDAIKSVQLE